MDCHNWVLSVLADISEYSGVNDLPKLQCMAERARSVAQVEIGEVGSDHYKELMKAVLAVEPSCAQPQAPSLASVRGPRCSKSSQLKSSAKSE